MGVRIGSGAGVPDPGHLDRLDTPTWERRGPFHELQERLRQEELREKYKDTNFHAAKPTRTPTAEQLDEINQHLERGERQEAIDKTIAYYGIDTGNVNGKVTYDSGLGARGETDKDRNVKIGPTVFTDADAGTAATAATILHEVTHANQVKHHAYPAERPGWSNARINQEFAAYEAMGYQAGLSQADAIGLSDDQKKWYQDKVDENRDKLTPGNRKLYDGGQYWGMK